jgi:medium-chain acyl-CoA synthetase
MKQEFKLEIPEYFNFAKDVLDLWTDMEKVWGKDQSHYSFSTRAILPPGDI